MKDRGRRGREKRRVFRRRKGRRKRYQKFIPLTLLGENIPAIIKEINMGMDITRRLATLGFNPGTDIEVIYGGAGPLLVLVRGTRIGLARGVADKIMVQLKEK